MCGIKFPLVVARGNSRCDFQWYVCWLLLSELPLTPSSGWFNVLSRVHSASPEQLLEMNHEQANPKNAVVSAASPRLGPSLKSTSFSRNNEACNWISYSMMVQIWVIWLFKVKKQNIHTGLLLSICTVWSIKYCSGVNRICRFRNEMKSNRITK